MNYFHNEYRKFLETTEKPVTPKQKKTFNQFIRRQFVAFVIAKKLTYENNLLRFRCLLIVRARNKDRLHDLVELTNFNIRVVQKDLSAFRSITIRPFGIALYKVDVRFKPATVASRGIHHNVFLYIQMADDYRVKKKLKYSQLTKLTDNKRFTYQNSRVLDVHGQAFFLRQSSDNKLTLVVRRKITSDLISSKLKITSARLVSFFVRLFWKPILFYEKESQQFEESSSVVFSHILTNRLSSTSYYVLSKRSKQYPEVKNKYGKAVLTKHSFRHYLAFFCTKTFIGTEAISHSIDLRIANRYASRKIFDRRNTYVFLQHGVTYMVSLASRYRKFARKDTGVYPDNTKIVVSSDKEAQHFIDVGKFGENSFYKSGMPKFDEVKLQKNPDRITIMPTWRPWEYNEIHSNPTETSYYKMLLEMVRGVPKQLHSKITILPHPLFYDSLLDSALGKYIDLGKNHDEVLQQTKVLVTDYSSVAFDSFYRGSNIIFWWKDIDECEAKYEAPILIKEEEPFGHIVYNKQELTTAVKESYSGVRNKSFEKAFKQIVAFNDNKNTVRLVAELQKDKII